MNFKICMVGLFSSEKRFIISLPPTGSNETIVSNWQKSNILGILLIQIFSRGFYFHK